MLEKTDKIWMDGKLVNWDDAKIHVLTHSLHYGLGIFEGIRCYNSKKGPAVFRLEEHVKRFFNSAHIFNMKLPFSEEEIAGAICKTVKANKMKECYIRPLAFYGYGVMGVSSKGCPVNVSIAVWPWGAYLGDDGLANGIRMKTSSFLKGHVNSNMSMAKVSAYYVNSQLAKQEALSCGYDEALLLDTEGYVSEATGANIFMARDGVIKTTPLTSILEGITRNTVIELAGEKGFDIREERFTRDEIYIADEAFLTGTAAEITPIRELDGRTIGTGKPGNITKELQDLFFNVVKGKSKNRKHERWLAYL
ncbi:MAG: branched-chain amino acid transaminase [Nitrospiraceae bacterium]|nr:branched-chain amino acid transaminase [Nitrospiraceae bacterium]